MPEKHNSWKKEKINCLLCKHEEYKILGIRGNREYFGADQNADPHVYTNVVKCCNCGFIYTNPMIKGFNHMEIDYYNNPQAYQATYNTNTLTMFKKRISFNFTRNK